MKRRNLLKLSTLAGAALAAPFAGPELLARSEAKPSRFDGPYWLFVTASGGWDPRFLFDPTLNPEQNRIYTEMGKVGNIGFAPIDATLEELNIELEMGAANPIVNPERFLQKHGSKLTVFNGVDTSTNNHDTGRRAFTSGATQEGYPAIGALLAAQFGRKQPLPFISFGGYDATFGLSPLSRVGNGNVLRTLAAPNVIDPRNEDSALYHTEATYNRIRAAQADRLQELMTAQALPKLNRAHVDLEAARLTDADLKALKVPELIDLPGGLNRAESLLRSGQMALAAFKAGLGVAANLSIGGFDTHGNHDTDQRRNLIQLLTGVSGLIDEVEAQGLSDKVYIVVGSDFGRTPHYNGENAGSGKDHWSITSTFALGPGIEGDRVIGATNNKQEALPINETSLQTGDGGVKLTPGRIHVAMRELAGIDKELMRDFQLVGAPLPLFG